jgi:hypothetical protein
MEITDYRVEATEVEYYRRKSQEFSGFAQQISKLINLGWQPLGGVAVTSGHDRNWVVLTPAMVRYEDKEGAE